MSKLDRISIKGFKSIKDIELELTSINVLIGSNGAGKSNFISFLEMLNFIVDKKLQYFVGKSSKKADSLLYYGRKVTKEIEGKLKFGPNMYNFNLEPTQANSLLFSNEAAIYIKKAIEYRINESPKDIEEERIAFKKSGHDETYLYESDRQSRYPWTISGYVIESLKNWKVYHFHDTGDNAPVKQTCDINDNKRLNTNASNLAAFLYLLKERHEENYKQIVSNIKLVAPFFGDFILRPNPLNPSSIQLEWEEKNSDEYFNAYALSDGTLRFICLATLLLQPKPPETIIIDEPELGLHPYAIKVLSSLIKKASFDSQIIISTQSVQLIEEFTPEDIITVDRVSGETKFQRHSSEELKDWIGAYTLGELWQKNILGGRP